MTYIYMNHIVKNDDTNILSILEFQTLRMTCYARLTILPSTLGSQDHTDSGLFSSFSSEASRSQSPAPLTMSPVDRFRLQPPMITVHRGFQISKHVNKYSKLCSIKSYPEQVPLRYHDCGDAPKK
jgi:hypothetical protein